MPTCTKFVSYNYVSTKSDVRLKISSKEHQIM